VRPYLARCLLATGRRAEATAKARAAVEGAAALGRFDLTAMYANTVLAACLTGDGKYAEAESHLLAAQKCLADPVTVLPGMRPLVADYFRWTAELYEAWGKPDEAAKWRARLKAWQP
jgi:tetratricopeptide (TPR) repeat protein